MISNIIGIGIIIGLIVCSVILYKKGEKAAHEMFEKEEGKSAAKK